MYCFCAAVEKYLSTGRIRFWPASWAGQITSPAKTSGVTLPARMVRWRLTKYWPVSLDWVCSTTLILPASILLKLLMRVGTVPVVSGPFQKMRVTGLAAWAAGRATPRLPVRAMPAAVATARTLRSLGFRRMDLRTVLPPLA